jgi:hypothetical protein
MEPLPGRWWRSRLSEAGDGHDLEIAILQVNHRDQVIHKRHLEGRPVTVHNQAILGHSGDDSNHKPETVAVGRPRLQPDQVLRPELAFFEDPAAFDENLRSPDRFGSLPAVDPFESDLKPLVDTTNRPYEVGAVLDPDSRAGVEVDDVLWLYIEAKKPAEAVGASKPPDPVTGTFSRRTRRQL